MVVLTEILQESSSSTYNYDVFLSFRGTDTRYNFTAHLHKALMNATITTFLDDAEIQIGEDLKPELESAIKSSRASIIVLSNNYASSSWCLDELALIMEQHRTSKHIVFPIFYHVKPTDVRKQQSSFENAMANHKKKMDAETNREKKTRWAHKMEKWKKALEEVANLKGEEANGRPETILIEKIVKEMCSRLDLHKRCKIPHIIGMESSITTITSFLKDGSSNTTDILTIWGMAGIGKTYLADYIFKLHHLDFDQSCFLEDIERKSISPDGLLDLQKQLLNDLRDKSWMHIQNTDVGTYMIEKSLLLKRTLLVIDGINRIEQLDMLIGTKGLHPGSKIIITSKIESLTEKCRMFKSDVSPNHTKHFLKGLNERESLELLSLHAYGNNEPKDDDRKEAIKVVQYCKGHPLALKVLGSSFRNEDATWEDILNSLGKEINPDIQKVLIISYESLPSMMDKELFKHIACFFVREDMKVTEEILKECGVCKSSGIKILINRCLLTVGSSNKLEMHQLLQDMGKDIVRQESPKKPWKRSLIWRHEDCLDVLQNRRGQTILIQGLVLDMKTSKDETSVESYRTNEQRFGFGLFELLNWIRILLSVIWWLYTWVFGNRSSLSYKKAGVETIAFKEMYSLRLLQLNYVQLNGSYKNFPKGLRWLCMHGFRLSYIPSDLQMDKVVALDMSHSKLKNLWKKPTLLRSLKFLNLSSCCELVRVGNFSCLPLLERLMLARCTSLLEICDSIGNYCDRLEVLDMSECNKLKKLPTSTGKLKNLRNLWINGCSDLVEVPCEIKDMESLEVFEANNILINTQSIVESQLPRSLKSVLISLPSSLVRLSLNNNNLTNESFPKDFSSLSMLKELHLMGNLIDSLPDCVRSLGRLDTLSLNDCRRLKKAISVPNTVQHLYMYDCFSLENITFYPEKSAPLGINYFDVNSLTEIQDMFKLQVLGETDEEILGSLGWTDIEYLKYFKVSMTDCHGCYHYTGKVQPALMLYEHGIFSIYLKGHEVPKWFTHRSNESSFTLQSSPKEGKIRGLNLCIVNIISSLNEVGPSRIEIRNLTKNSSWTYQPVMHILPEDSEFEYGHQIIVWLTHWIFGNNEFQDGDEVSVHFSVKYTHNPNGYGLFYGGEGPDYAHVKEYGISLVYDDEGNQNKDPLAYCKSWNHIIGRDLSDSEVSSNHYLLKHGP